jgi:hypothetical protein
VYYQQKKTIEDEPRAFKNQGFHDFLTKSSQDQQ